MLGTVSLILPRSVVRQVKNEASEAGGGQVIMKGVKCLLNTMMSS